MTPSTEQVQLTALTTELNRFKSARNQKKPDKDKSDKKKKTKSKKSRKYEDDWVRKETPYRGKV